MKSIYYSATWTDSAFLLGCSHEHETIVEADSCIPCAGGYVVGVENGVMRSLTAEEEAEFQRVHYAPRTDKPPLDLVLIRLSELEMYEVERMYAEDEHALLEALGNRFRTVLKLKSGCH